MFVTRAIHLFPQIKARLEALGFPDVTVTAAAKDGLTMLVNELKPRLLMMGSGFYQAGTPYMLGELRKVFPKLNIAAVSVHDFPASLAVYFIWHGIKSYVNLWEGYEEFHRGLQLVREGKEYVSPVVRHLIDNSSEWPDTDYNLTKRHMECLILLCCGFIPERIGEELHISRKTVNNHLASLYALFHVQSREEMVALAWELELVTKSDIRFYNRKPLDFPLPGWAERKKQLTTIHREGK